MPLPRPTRRLVVVIVLAITVLLVAGTAVALLSGDGDGPRYDVTATSPVVPDATVTDEVDADDGAGQAERGAIGAPEGQAAIPAIDSAGTPGAPLPSTQVIKTATVTVDLDDAALDRSVDTILDAIATRGGFVQQTDVGDARATLVLRVPAAEFEAALSDVRALGEVTTEAVSGQDVSEEYVDIESRQRNLAAQEVVLLSLMQEAETVADTIAVQQQLSAVQEQSELLEGRRRLLDDQTGYSTIEVRLTELGAVAVGSGSPAILAEAWDRATAAALEVLGGTLVVIGVLVPLTAVVAPIALVVWLVRRRRPAVSA